MAVTCSRGEIRVEAVCCLVVALLAGAGSSAERRGGHPDVSVSGALDEATTDALLAGRRLPLHHATRSEIEALPGVGPVLAGRMLAARRDGACWTSLDALHEVHGIGPHTIDGLRSYAYGGCLP